jgi:hypothetical protein
MAWERRTGEGQYYTRSKRVNGWVVREYVGSGEIAEIEHQIDLMQREERQRRREALKMERDSDEALSKNVELLEHLADCIARSLLVASGCHQHKRGEWRKRNGRTTKINGTNERNRSTTDADSSGEYLRREPASRRAFVVVVEPESRKS